MPCCLLAIYIYISKSALSSLSLFNDHWLSISASIFFSLFLFSQITKIKCFKTENKEFFYYILSKNRQKLFFLSNHSKANICIRNGIGINFYLYLGKDKKKEDDDDSHRIDNMGELLFFCFAGEAICFRKILNVSVYFFSKQRIIQNQM